MAKVGNGPHVTQTLKGPESLRLSEMVRCHGVAVAQEGRTLKQGCFAAIGVFVNRGMRGKLRSALDKSAKINTKNLKMSPVYLLPDLEVLL